MVAAQVSSSRVACGTRAAAARGSARRRGRGAPRGSCIDPDTAAPLDTGCASSAVRPAAQASSHQEASTRKTQLALMPLTATDECTLQMQPSAPLSVYHSTWKQSSTCSSGRACHPHACCPYPSPAPVCAERPLPASSAVGPLSSESTVPTLHRLRRRLLGLCLASPRRRANDSTLYSNRLQRYSIHIDSGPGRPEVGR